MKSNFLCWFEDADIALKDQDGNWYDAETGFPYDPSKKYGSAKPARKTLSEKAEESRSIAKMFGAKALLGTAKQKEWAEQIRADKLAQMSEEQAILACDKKGILNHSKFWINSRNMPGSRIGEFAQEYKQKLSEFRALKNKVILGEASHSELESAAQDYNDLTASWGFQ